MKFAFFLQKKQLNARAREQAHNVRGGGYYCDGNGGMQGGGGARKVRRGTERYGVEGVRIGTEGYQSATELPTGSRLRKNANYR